MKNCMFALNETRPQKEKQRGYARGSYFGLIRDMAICIIWNHEVISYKMIDKVIERYQQFPVVTI